MWQPSKTVSETHRTQKRNQITHLSPRFKIMMDQGDFKPLEEEIDLTKTFELDGYLKDHETEIRRR